MASQNRTDPFQNRVNYAASCIIAGRKGTRGFARCFQAGDDEYVVEALIRRAQSNPALGAKLYEFVDKDFASAAHRKFQGLSRSALAQAARQHIELGQRDRKAFYAENRDRFVTDAAWGSWHPSVPDGMVIVKAQRRSDNRTRYFLVPEQDYARRSPFGLVVQESQHMECASIT